MLASYLAPYKHNAYKKYRGNTIRECTFEKLWMPREVPEIHLAVAAADRLGLDAKVDADRRYVFWLKLDDSKRNAGEGVTR